MPAATGAGPAVRMSDENLTDLSDIRAALAALAEEEHVHDSELREMIGRHGDVEVKMATLQRMAPKLQKLFDDSKSLSDVVGSTCALAEHVSSKVRELDTVKGRLQETVDRVDGVIGLRSCVDGTQEALKVGDYKKAAEFVHQYLTFDKALLESEGTGSNGGGDGGATQDGADKLLRDAHQTVKAAINEKFDVAAESGDADAAEEYFVLFPLVGDSAEGLVKYGRFLASEIASGAETRLKQKIGGDEISFVSLVSKLVEETATVITKKQPLVDSNYGKGQMLLLIKPLQEQCDASASTLLQKFIEDRGLNSLDAASTDSRELEVVLAELASIMQRGELYLQFLRSHIMAELKYIDSVQDPDAKAKLPNPKTHGLVVANGDLAMQVQGLIGQYITLEESGLKNMVAKAIELNQKEMSGALTTTVVDDAFFVISKSARRSMSTLSANCMCVMVNQICAMIETTYIGVFNEPLQAALGSGSLSNLFGAVNSATASLAYKSTSTNENSEADDVLVIMNNLDVSHKYALKLYTDLGRESKRLYCHTSSATDLSKITSCLEGVASSASQLESLLKESMSQFCLATLAPKLKPMAESLSNFNFVLAEDDLVSTSQFVQAYVAALKATLAPYESSLLERNFELLLSTLSGELATQLEKAVLRTTFNKIGGLQFDTDLRVIIACLSSFTQWSCRDRFAKLTQMSQLLCLDTVREAHDYVGPTAMGRGAGLSKAEAKDTLERREDFESRDINAL